MAVGSIALALWALRELRDAPVALEVRGNPPATSPVARPDELVLTPATFAELPGWNEDDLRGVREALLASCAKWPRSPGESSLSQRLAEPSSEIAATCERLAKLGPADMTALRELLVERFDPYTLGNHGEREGLFTGYYEPELRGSRRKKAPFVHPLYLAPRDSVVLDLGDFKKDLAGRKVTGMIRDGRFRPYWDRAEIERGALAGRGLEMLWVDDAVALFFLQIQGSGRVALPDGSFVRVGYAAQNGHDYTAIGKVLIERGELEREKVSLQTIRAWLLAHPEQADEVMASNRSYVFFRVLPGAPVGSSGVELTPGRSLAIDPGFLPYGLPLWLDTTYPDESLATVPAAEAPEPRPLRRLVVGQDRGGAIRGPVRGDLFWGPGAEAESIAGRMKQRGRLWILWPKAAGPPD